MNIPSFQRKVMNFYAERGRSLPWRRTTDPYKILVSEIMLQQTQVNRVLRYYPNWVKRWPTIHTLAKAFRKSVLKEWMGLGYNSRALNLHKAAKKISSEFNGGIIKALNSGEKIPGIGPYTEKAVRIFAKNEDIVTIDTNIRRLLLHEFRLKESTPDKKLWKLAEQCLPKGKSREWHNALMDYGATFLTSRKTGIRPKTTQSKFGGSDRQMRAQVLKTILRKPRTLQELKTSFPDVRLLKILEGMRRDGMIGGKEKYSV